MRNWDEGTDLRLDLQGALARSASVQTLPGDIAAPLAADEAVIELGMASVEGIVGYLFCTTERLLFISADGNRQLTVSMSDLESSSEMTNNGILISLPKKRFTIRMSAADQKIIGRYMEAIHPQKAPEVEPLLERRKAPVSKSEIERPYERAIAVRERLSTSLEPVAQLIEACENSTMPKVAWDRVELPEMKALSAGLNRLLSVTKPAVVSHAWEEIDDVERKAVVAYLSEAESFLESRDTSRLRSTANSLVNRFLKASYEEEPTREVKVPSKKPPPLEYHLEVPTVHRPHAQVVDSVADLYLPVAERETATYAVVAAVLALLVGLVPVIGVVAVPVGAAAIGLGWIAEQDNKRFANPAMFVGLLGFALGTASGFVLAQQAGII